MMNKISLLLTLLTIGFVTNAQQKHNAAAKILQSTPVTDWVKQKNYALLTLIEDDKKVSNMLEGDPELVKIASDKANDIKTSLTDCKETACFVDRYRFTLEQIKTVSARLVRLCKPGSALYDMVVKRLIPSGAYNLNKGLQPAEFLAKAWEQDATGINNTLDIYAGGKKPNYPAIDSIGFNVQDKRYPVLLYDASATLVGDLNNQPLFFTTPLQAALLFLQINERQDPANYEPMASTVNHKAVESIKSINWAKYPYTVILIPGAGPDDLTTALSPEGMLRCRLAAQQYNLGKAPYIMPSGGKAHPYKTKFCEAEEMKRYLVQTLQIPESAVIMEPHARHTTTNMRNCARLMFEYKMPTASPGLVITDKSQTDAIMNMAARCMRELNYVPYKLGNRLCETQVEFYPLFNCMQINPYEPLDP